MQTMLQTLDDLFLRLISTEKSLRHILHPYNTWFYTYLAYHLSVMMILALELCQRSSHLAN